MSDRQVVLYTTQISTGSSEPVDEPSDALLPKWEVPDYIDIVDLDEAAVVMREPAQNNAGTSGLIPAPLDAQPEDLPEDLPVPVDTVPDIPVPPQTSNAAKLIVIKPSYAALDLEVAYSHSILPGETPEMLMRGTDSATFQNFVLAAEVGLENEGCEGKSLRESIEEAGHGYVLVDIAR